MRKIYFLLLLLIAFSACKKESPKDEQMSTINTNITRLSLAEANRLAALPLKCIQTEFPNKTGHVTQTVNDIKTPAQMHPAFYGCFDWHSAVHGHWSLVYLLKHFPELEKRDSILQLLKTNMSKENITTEVKYFDGENRNFERTYGWAWLLKLAEELESWPNNEDALILSQNLKPLTDLIVSKYMQFLPKLQYPVREGTHANTAFGMAFAYDYAVFCGHDSLKLLIEDRARYFYSNDTDCPMRMEPGGYDFLSPCLQEAFLMSKILPKNDFELWMINFLPALSDTAYKLIPGVVSDRTDGHLVHLDGVNFSRAWCLYGIAQKSAQYKHLQTVAHQHLMYSLPGITDGNYEGGHWLGSFALYALGSLPE